MRSIPQERLITSSSFFKAQLFYIPFSSMWYTNLKRNQQNIPWFKNIILKIVSLKKWNVKIDEVGLVGRRFLSSDPMTSKTPQVFLLALSDGPATETLLGYYFLWDIPVILMRKDVRWETVTERECVFKDDRRKRNRFLFHSNEVHHLKFQ